MKSYIDFFETIKSEFVGHKRFRSRFIKYWGTTTIDGVKVLNKRFTVYPGTNDDVTIAKMCRLLGMWDSVSDADFSKIAGYYLYLNPDKETENQEKLIAELLAEKIDLLCPLDTWKYATINYIDKNDPTKFDGWTKEQILTYIDNDYRNIFDYGNGFVAADTVDEEAIGKYVLFDDGTEFEVEVLSVVKTAVAIPVETTAWNLGDAQSRTRYTGLSVEIRFKRIAIDISVEGALMTAIKAEQDEYQVKKLAAMQKSTGTSYDDDGYSIWTGSTTTTNEIWYKDYMRYDAVMAYGIPSRYSNKILLSTLDTGYIKKKVKKWKKFLIDYLSITLIVGAIIIATITGQWWLVAVASGIVTGLQMLVAQHWGVEYGEYMGRWVKVANIAAIVTGIYNIIQNIALRLGTEAAKQAATNALVQAGATTAEATLVTATASIETLTAINTALGATSSITTSTILNVATELVIDSWKSIAFKVAEFAVKARQADMTADLAEKSAYAEELQDQLESSTDKNLHIGLMDLKTFPENLQRIKSAQEINYKYEKEYATIHIGNIQRASFYKATGLNLRAEDLM